MVIATESSYSTNFNQINLNGYRMVQERICPYPPTPSAIELEGKASRSALIMVQLREGCISIKKLLEGNVLPISV